MVEGRNCYDVVTFMIFNPPGQYNSDIYLEFLGYGERYQHLLDLMHCQVVHYDS